MPYGRFDPHRLIAGLILLIDPSNEEITIGLDIGAIHTAEALLLARYFMYTQVYFHDVRRAYDKHLMEFLKVTLDDGRFPTNWKKILEVTDEEVIVAMREAAADGSHRWNKLASRVLCRKHFRTIYELVSTHKRKRPTIFDDMVSAARDEFGEELIRNDSYGPKSESNDFPVLTEANSVESSLQVSGVIATLQPVEIGLIFADPSVSERAKGWANNKVNELLS